MLATVVDAINHGLGDTQSTLAVVVAAATSLIALLLVCTHNPVAKSPYPLVGENAKYYFFKGIRQRLHWFKNGPQLIHSSFKRFPHTLFTLPSLDRTSIVLPPRYLQEIRDLTSKVASNSHATADVSMSLQLKLRTGY